MGQAEQLQDLHRLGLDEQFFMGHFPGHEPRRPQVFADLSLRHQHQVIQHGHALHLPGNLEGAHQAQPKGLVHPHAIDAPTVEHNPPAGRRHGAGNQIEQRRLTCAVRADQPRDSALAHIERAMVDRPHSTELLDDIAYLEQRRRVGRLRLDMIGRHVGLNVLASCRMRRSDRP